MTQSSKNSHFCRPRTNKHQRPCQKILRTCPNSQLIFKRSQQVTKSHSLTNSFMNWSPKKDQSRKGINFSLVELSINLSSLLKARTWSKISPNHWSQSETQVLSGPKSTCKLLAKITSINNARVLFVGFAYKPKLTQMILSFVHAIALGLLSTSI